MQNQQKVESHWSSFVISMNLLYKVSKASFARLLTFQFAVCSYNLIWSWDLVRRKNSHTMSLWNVYDDFLFTNNKSPESRNSQVRIQSVNIYCVCFLVFRHENGKHLIKIQKNVRELWTARRSHSSTLLNISQQFLLAIWRIFHFHPLDTRYHLIIRNIHNVIQYLFGI